MRNSRKEEQIVTGGIGVGNAVLDVAPKHK